AVEGSFRWRVQLREHARDGSAAAGSGQTANEYVVAGSGKLGAHLQRAQCAFLADEAFPELRLRGGFERDARKLAPPAQFGRRKFRVLWCGLGGRSEEHTSELQS